MARSLRAERRRLALALGAALLCGCGATNTIVFDEDAGSDAGVDAGSDAGSDAGADAGFDAGADAGSDAGSDAGVDAGADAGSDAGSDAGVDAGPTTYSVGGALSGVAGSGLVLELNGAEDLPLPADGPFHFATRLTSGQGYTVVLKSPPVSPVQRCTLEGASGTVTTFDITTIAVACTTNPSYSLGGTVTGLLGQGLSLQANSGESLAISADGAFSFAGLIQSTLPYSVTVAAQPFTPYQVCSVARGEGFVPEGDVTDIAVTCGQSPLFTIGGVVSGLVGQGLVLEDDGVDDLPISGNGVFTFATPLEEDVPYQVTVRSQPQSPLQTCTVAQGTAAVGPNDVTNVAVTCTTNQAFSIGGTIVGLTGAGLKLQDNGGDELSIASDGPFTFAHGVQSSLGYRVSVSAQPSGQLCEVTAGGAGQVANANIRSVVVSCGTTPFIPVTVEVSGLLGRGLLLEDNGNDPLAISADGNYTFANQLVAGQPFAVTVAAQPSAPFQTCTLTGGSGQAVSGAVDVALQCANNPSLTIGGTITGLAGSGLVLTDNGGDALTPTAGGTFTFPTPLQSGATYRVAIAVQPSAPFQTCTVNNGFGTVGAVPIGNISIVCNSNQYWLIGGAVTGLVNNNVVLQDNGANDTTVSANGTFIFTVLHQSGEAYSITVKTQPTNPPLVCTVSSGSGTLDGDNMLSALVSCAPPPAFPVGGTVTGLDGTGLTLANNGADLLTVSQNGPFSFPTPRASGGNYNAAVTVQPVNPAQSCRVQSGSGFVGSAPVNNIGVVCITRTFTIGGVATGLPAGSTATLLDNGVDKLVVNGSSDGSTPINFTFATTVQSNRAYAATLLTSSGPVSCALSSASGTVSAAGANVTSLQLACVPAFPISGTLSGVAGSGLQLNNSTTGETLTLSKGATTFAFSRAVTQAQGYAISVAAQPLSASQSCSYTSGSTAASGNPTAAVTGIAFACATTPFTVGGTVSGLPAGSAVTLLDNGGDATLVNGAGDGTAPIAFNFNTSINSGAGWSAKVSASSGPVSCSVTSGATGTVGNGPASAIRVSCAPTFSISGALVGYTGSGLQLVLKNQAANTTLQTLSLSSGSSSFAFTTLVSQATGYSLSIVQPTSTPKQVCSFDPTQGAPAGSPTANIGNIAVDCGSPFFAIGGAVSGLPAGSSVTLLDNGFDKLVVSGTASGTPAFTFPTQLLSGQTYAATVVSAAGPVSCAIGSGGAGTVSAAVNTIQVVCAPGFTVGGSLSGYAGSGLQLNNAATGETITVASGATTFAFSRAVSTAQGYSISVATQPGAPSQSCSAGSSGSPLAGSPSANVTDVSLVCANNSFVIGGAVAGLPAGASVNLVNAGDTITVAGAGDGTTPQPFTFDVPVVSGQTWSASVSSASGPVSCGFTSGATGTMASAPVTTLAVTCAPGWYIGGTLSLYTGAGLQLKNGTTGEVITVPQAATTFAFNTPVSTAQGYALSFAAQPTGPVQSCALSLDSPAPLSAKPAANVFNIAILCTTSSFKIGGNVTGLAAGTSVKLLDNGFDSTTITGAGDGSTPIPFNFPNSLTSGLAWSARVTSTTGGIVCTLTNGSGVVGNAAVTNLQVGCAPSFTIAGTLSGYSGSGLKLLNGTSGEAITIAPGKSSFAFALPVSQAQGYALSVVAQPVNPAQLCAVSASSPSPAAGNPSGNVSTVALACSAATFTVGGVVNGLTSGGLVLEDNGGDDLPFGVQSPDYPDFVFATPIPSGMGYSVSVRTQPPGQLCTPRDGTAIGPVTSAAIHTVIIDCAPAQRLGGVVNGLVGSGLVLSDGFESLPLAANGGAALPFTFRAPLAQGQAYFVYVATQPGSPVQRCSAGGGNAGNDDGSGTIGTSDDTSLVISCGPPGWSVGGTIEGAANGTFDALALLDNGVDQLVLSITPASSGNAGSFVFNAPVFQGQSYQVTVETPPANLACIVHNGSGVMSAGNVTHVQVICGYPLTGSFDIGALNGITGEPPAIALSLSNAVAPGPNSDSYADSEMQSLAAGAAGFAFNDPVPYGRSCLLSLAGPTSSAGQLCFFESTGGCNGAPVTAPLAPSLRCNPVPAIALVPFPGATGSAYGVGVNADGGVTVGLEFTGAVDLGHGARTASTFKSGTNKTVGSGALAGFDSNGYKGSDSTPAGANWDQLIPTVGAVKSNVGAAKVRAVAQGAAGDIVVGGSFIGSVDFGDGNGAFNAGGTESMFLARYSSAGALVWAHPFGAGAIASVAFNGTRIVAGGVFGTTGSSETFASKTGSSAACTALTAATSHRDFIAGFDFAAGGCSFSVNIGAGADPNTLPLRLGPAVALDSTGNALAAGNALDTKGPTKQAGPYLLAYSGAGALACSAGGVGNELYQETTTPSNDQLNALAVGPGDLIYVTGSCQGSPKVQGAIVSGCGSGAPALFIAQYAPGAACSAGQLVGAQGGGAVLSKIALGGASVGTALAIDASGSVYLGGSYQGAPAFGSSTLFAGSSALGQNLFLARFPPALTSPVLEALNATGALSLTGLAVSPSGAAWASGAYSGTVTYLGATTLGATAAAPEPMLVQFPQAAP